MFSVLSKTSHDDSDSSWDKTTCASEGHHGVVYIAPIKMVEKTSVWVEVSGTSYHFARTVKI